MSDVANIMLRLDDLERAAEVARLDRVFDALQRTWHAFREGMK
jgi:hypothetical protein